VSFKELLSLSSKTERSFGPPQPQAIREYVLEQLPILIFRVALYLIRTVLSGDRKNDMKEAMLYSPLEDERCNAFFVTIMYYLLIEKGLCGVRENQGGNFIPSYTAVPSP